MSTSAVFLIMPLGNDPQPEKLAAAVRDLDLPTFDGCAPDAWLVYFDGTAKQISERLARPEQQGGIGTHLVVHVDRNYFGYGSREMWSWLSERT